MKEVKSSLLSRITAFAKEIDPTSEVILYGSRARGDEQPDSDWDILILVDSATDLDYERLFRHKLYDIELEVGEAFSVTVKNRTEWDSRFWMTPLYQNISREGIRI